MWSSKAKYCVTCANWGGNRKLNVSGWAETDSPGERGKCYMGVGTVIPGPRACDGFSCSKYTPWSAVKR